jgi:hypothetical protein
MSFCGVFGFGSIPYRFTEKRQKTRGGGRVEERMPVLQATGNTQHIMTPDTAHRTYYIRDCSRLCLCLYDIYTGHGDGGTPLGQCVQDADTRSTRACRAGVYRVYNIARVCPLACLDQPAAALPAAMIALLAASNNTLLPT